MKIIVGKDFVDKMSIANIETFLKDSINHQSIVECVDEHIDYFLKLIIRRGKKYERIVEILLKEKLMNPDDALIYASEDGNQNVVRLAFKYGAVEIYSAVCKAKEFGDRCLVKFLETYGAQHLNDMLKKHL